MSHVVRIETQFLDLEALKDACEKLGLEFRENQKHYRWYERYMGDYPLPQGFSAKDLGQCEHAIGIKGNHTSYEVGVARARTETGSPAPGYTLLFDFWAGGGGLVDKVGQGGHKLIQQYSVEVARRHLRARGRRVTEERTLDGRIILRGKR